MAVSWSHLTKNRKRSVLEWRPRLGNRNVRSPRRLDGVMTSERWLLMNNSGRKAIERIQWYSLGEPFVQKRTNPINALLLDLLIFVASMDFYYVVPFIHKFHSPLSL